MTPKRTVTIHNNEYLPVHERVKDALKDNDKISITTVVLSHTPVVIQAFVKTERGEFNGISSVSLDTGKTIERYNPYEVAETSAVGRALGFAGYGIDGGIASAEEMKKPIPYTDDEGRIRVPTEDAHKDEEPPIDLDQADAEIATQLRAVPDVITCEVCGQPAQDRRGTTKGGKPYHGLFCTSQDRTHTKWLWN